VPLFMLGGVFLGACLVPVAYGSGTSLFFAAILTWMTVYPIGAGCVPAGILRWAIEALEPSEVSGIKCDGA
jgi:hypothetical protein